MKVAEAKVGTRVIALREFAGIPEGCEGVIDEDYNSGVMVAWDLPNRPLPEGWTWDPEDGSKWAAAPGAPQRDGFDKEEELQYLSIEPHHRVLRSDDREHEWRIGSVKYCLTRGRGLFVWKEHGWYRIVTSVPEVEPMIEEFFLLRNRLQEAEGIVTDLQRIGKALNMVGLIRGAEDE